MKDNQLTQGLPAVTARILALKQQTAESVIELGLALIAAKAIVPRGQWDSYLANEVDFTHRTANNFMRIAQVFGDGKWKTFSNLTSSKLLELAALPDADRETALRMPDISTISVRELKSRLAQIRHREKTLRDKVIDVFGEPQEEKRINEFDATIADLKYLPGHDRYFGRRTGEDWIDFLQYVSDVIKDPSERHRKWMLPIVVTNDMTVIDGYERIRAFRDLGMEKIPARVLTLSEAEIEDFVEQGMDPERIAMHFRIWMHWSGHTAMADYCEICFSLERGETEKALELWDRFEQTREQKNRKLFDHVETKVTEFLREGFLSEEAADGILEIIHRKRKRMTA